MIGKSQYANPPDFQKIQLRGVTAFQGEHVSREVVEFFVIQRKLGHKRPWRDGWRIFEMLKVPGAVRATISYEREVWRQISAFPMDPVTGFAIKLHNQPHTTVDGGIFFWYGVQLLKRRS